MSNPSYSRVNWEDSPSTNTPVNAENLNKMDKGISDCASAIATKQESTDNNLTTTAKTIRGAINEINADLTTLPSSRIRVSFMGGSNGNGFSNDLSQIIADNTPAGKTFSHFDIIGFINNTSWSINVFLNDFASTSFNAYSSSNSTVKFTIDLYYK